MWWPKCISRFKNLLPIYHSSQLMFSIISEMCSNVRGNDTKYLGCIFSFGLQCGPTIYCNMAELPERLTQHTHIPRASRQPHMGQIESWPQLLSHPESMQQKSASFHAFLSPHNKEEGTDSPVDSLCAVLRSDVNPLEVRGQVFSS